MVEEEGEGARGDRSTDPAVREGVVEGKGHCIGGAQVHKTPTDSSIRAFLLAHLNRGPSERPTSQSELMLNFFFLHYRFQSS